MVYGERVPSSIVFSTSDGSTSTEWDYEMRRPVTERNLDKKDDWDLSMRGLVAEADITAATNPYYQKMIMSFASLISSEKGNKKCRDGDGSPNVPTNITFHKEMVSNNKSRENRGEPDPQEQVEIVLDEPTGSSTGAVDTRDIPNHIPRGSTGTRKAPESRMLKRQEGVQEQIELVLDNIYSIGCVNTRDDVFPNHFPRGPTTTRQAPEDMLKSRQEGVQEQIELLLDKSVDMSSSTHHGGNIVQRMARKRSFDRLFSKPTSQSHVIKKKPHPYNVPDEDVQLHVWSQDESFFEI